MDDVYHRKVIIHQEQSEQASAAEKALQTAFPFGMWRAGELRKRASNLRTQTWSSLHRVGGISTGSWVTNLCWGLVT